jgi:hypothetical protein
MENQDTLSELVFLNDNLTKETEEDISDMQSELNQLVNDVIYDLFGALQHNSNVNSSFISDVEQQLQVLDETKSVISNFAEVIHIAVYVYMNMCLYSYMYRHYISQCLLIFIQVISSFATLTNSLKNFDGNEPIVEKKIFVTRAQNTEESGALPHIASQSNSRQNLGKTFTSEDNRKSSHKRKSESKSAPVPLCVSPIEVDERK